MPEDRRLCLLLVRTLFSNWECWTSLRQGQTQKKVLLACLEKSAGCCVMEAFLSLHLCIHQYLGCQCLPNILQEVGQVKQRCCGCPDRSRWTGG